MSRPSSSREPQAASSSGPRGNFNAEREANTYDEAITIEPGFGLSRSITGADLTLPIFDGISTDPSQCLIELDNDSMEKFADVRLYFWCVGSSFATYAQRSAAVKHTLVEARAYDDQVVKKGRLHVKACREQGIGFYLNKGRDFASHGQPGSPWYRTPALAIVRNLVHGKSLQAEEDEGFFKKPTQRPEDHYTPGEVILTNIRIPILFAEFKTDDFRPGTATWEEEVGNYYVHDSPIKRLIQGADWEQLIHDNELFTGVIGSRHTPVTVEDIEQMVRRDWAAHCPPPEPQGPPPNMLELTNGGKAKHFFRDDVRKPSSKKKFGRKNK